MATIDCLSQLTESQLLAQLVLQGETGTGSNVTVVNTSANPVPVTIVTGTTAVRTSSAAYEAQRVLKSSPGTLIGLTGYNSAATAIFIQLFNAIAVPADGATPVLLFTVPATSNFAFDMPVTGMPFTTGICVSNSSTGPTKTVGGSTIFYSAVVQ